MWGYTQVHPGHKLQRLDSFHLSPKTTRKIFQKTTRRLAEYPYLGHEPDDVNEVGGLHGTPRKEHRNIVSPGDVYGADEP